MTSQLNYGNWVRRKNLYILGLLTLAIGLLILIPLGNLYRFMISFLFLVLLVSFFFPFYAYIMFSQNGGKLQEKIYNLVIQKLGTNLKGNILDIGSGNGVLSVLLAQKHREIKIIGMDYWGKDWEYSKNVCEENARLIKAQDRVNFQRGDAASLDFDDISFDGVISNLTFHEVKSVADKSEVVSEALRVLKPGGAFSFVDYFFESKYYGRESEFENYLTKLNLSNYELKALHDVIKIPALLNHPKIFGKVGILYGKK